MNDVPRHYPAALTAIMGDAEQLGFAMSCDPRTGSLLATLAASKPGGRVLELGTGVGAGAAWLLDGMDAVATLHTVDADPVFQTVAVRHLSADPRISFEVCDGNTWLDQNLGGDGYDLMFVDCRPGKFHRLGDAVALLRPGGLYVVDDLLPQVTWPADHQERVNGFLAAASEQPDLRVTAMAWASGLVVGVRP